VLSLVGFGGSIDFVISRSQEPGWVGQMINWLIDPPGWSVLPLIGLGLTCIYWDAQRQLAMGGTSKRVACNADRASPSVEKRSMLPESIGNWQKPLAAIEMFATRELVEIKNKWAAALEQSIESEFDAAEKINSLSNSEDAEKLEHQRRRLHVAQMGGRLAQDELRRAWSELREDMASKLERRALVAKGVAAPHVPGNNEIEIPAHEWRILYLDPTDETAHSKSDNSVKYLGVVIAKADKPEAVTNESGFKRSSLTELTEPPSEDDRLEKQKLISDARSLAINADDDFRHTLERSSVYYQLRPYLSESFNHSVRMGGRVLIAPPPGSKLPGLAHKFLEPIQKVVESEESVVLPSLAPASLLRGAECGRLNTVVLPTAMARATRAI